MKTAKTSVYAQHQGKNAQHQSQYVINTLVTVSGGDGIQILVETVKDALRNLSGRNIRNKLLEDKTVK